MDDIRLISNELMREAIAEALGREIGPRRPMTDEQAADLLGVDVRTLQSWRLGETAPCLYKFIRLCRLFGEPFANEFLGHAGLRSEPVHEGDGCHFHANRRIVSAAFTFANALDDGHVDHVEERDLIQAVRDLIDFLPGFLAARDPKVRPIRAAE